MAEPISLSPAARVRGEVTVPGDKSISHRALLLAALADGASQIEGRARGADQDAMTGCLRELGVTIGDEIEVTNVLGVGLRGLASPPDDLDCGNSGATMRFLTGVLAGIPGVEARLVGDRSLSSRPMDRIAAPLHRMGAAVDTEGGRPPLRVTGRPLHGAEHKLDVASAQVKTAILLAALNAEGRTSIVAPLSRDHTERMLLRLGVDVVLDGAGSVEMTPPESLPGFQMTVPGDPSAAAFWVVLATAHPDAELTVRNVCLNPTRAGFLDVLGRMGAEVAVVDVREVAGEAVADLQVRSATLNGTQVDPGEVPSLVDEIPVLSVAAALAEGETRFSGVGELRLKEVDRVAAIADQLGLMGAVVTVEGDDLVVSGTGRLRGASLGSGGDHRMAMSLAVAASVAEGPSTVGDAEAVDISYPDFYAELSRLSD